MEKSKKRTLNELRQVKTYGYTPPSPSKEKVKKDSKNQNKIEKKQYICKMETKENSHWDVQDFKDWVVRNIDMVLSGKQLQLFIKNRLGYDDLKLFGKIEEAEKLKSMYQNNMFDKVITTYTIDRTNYQNLNWVSIN